MYLHAHHVMALLNGMASPCARDAFDVIDAALNADPESPRRKSQDG